MGKVGVHDVRAALMAVTSTDQVRQVMDALISGALSGDVQAIKTYLYYAGARPLQPEIPDLSWDDLDDLQGCLRAYKDIGRAQVAGVVDDKQAAALRATVEGCMKVHLAEAGQSQHEDLMSLGSEVLYLDAADSEGALQKGLEFLQREGESDADGS